MTIRVEFCDRCHENIRPETAYISNLGNLCGNCGRKAVIGIAANMAQLKQDQQAQLNNPR